MRAGGCPAGKLKSRRTKFVLLTSMRAIVVPARRERDKMFLCAKCAFSPKELKKDLGHVRVISQFRR